MAGIEQSEFILSVNSNPDAAIIKQSDAVIVGDYKEVLEPVFVCLTEWNQKEKEKIAEIFSAIFSCHITYPIHHDW